MDKLHKLYKFCEPCRHLLMTQEGFNKTPSGAAALAYNIQLRDLFIIQAMLVCAKEAGMTREKLPEAAVALADEMIEARMKT